MPCQLPDEIATVTDDVFSYMCNLAMEKCSKKADKKKASCGGAAMRKRLLIKNFVSQMLAQDRQSRDRSSPVSNSCAAHLDDGSFSPRNVARCSTYETSLAGDMDLSDDCSSMETSADELSYADGFEEYFAPNYRLHIDASDDSVRSPTDYLEAAVQENTVIEDLGKLSHAPNVQMHAFVRDGMQLDDSLDYDRANRGKFYDDRRSGRPEQKRRWCATGEPLVDPREGSPKRSKTEQQQLLKTAEHPDEGGLFETAHVSPIVLYFPPVAYF